VVQYIYTTEGTLTMSIQVAYNIYTTEGGFMKGYTSGTMYLYN
jgi:hypothetical protein